MIRLYRTFEWNITQPAMCVNIFLGKTDPNPPPKHYITGAEPGVSQREKNIPGFFVVDKQGLQMNRDVYHTQYGRHTSRTGGQFHLVPLRYYFLFTRHRDVAGILV